ncbi:MAG: hypothetical protein NT122_03310 [Solirubrobacterales bacterium]|nr:hypothetical protein [Solirubrobacterales bacterium]
MPTKGLLGSWAPLSSFVGGNGLYEIIGAAAPVATPMSGRPTPPFLR